MNIVTTELFTRRVWERPARASRRQWLPQAQPAAQATRAASASRSGSSHLESDEFDICLAGGNWAARTAVDADA